MAISVTVEIRCEVCQHQESITTRHHVLYDALVIKAQHPGWDYGVVDDVMRCPGCVDPGKEGEK